METLADKILEMKSIFSLSIETFWTFNVIYLPFVSICAPD